MNDAAAKPRPSFSGSGGSSWYPIVFPEKCDGCQGIEAPKCIEFCPHDVYALVDGKAIVARPQNCVNGCVACRPLCPRGAIDFPQDVGFMRGKDRAWSEGLRKLTCRRCGKVFWSNSETELCWNCLEHVEEEVSR